MQSQHERSGNQIEGKRAVGKRGETLQSAVQKRVQVSLDGIVQGVGFRPFVHRLAHELKVRGWVHNSAQGVRLEAEGSTEQLNQFLKRLQEDKPRNSDIHHFHTEWLPSRGYEDFKILSSKSRGPLSVLTPPDLATCPECLQEVLDPHNRRHTYPFTNCTQCGPRFSIIDALPYDRPNTSMRTFEMCPQCLKEYKTIGNRRFHAQPNACPECGPHLELWNGHGRCHATHTDALHQAIAFLKGGAIVAVKGIGGFHLMVDAFNEDAIRRLRRRKQRPAKPFAVMYSSTLAIRTIYEVSVKEEALLCSPAAPIVLLRIKDSSGPLPAPSVAPNNPWHGVFLPYTPLHHLILRGMQRPVVATSGNLSEEPLCYQENEVIERLGAIADVFLVHNRPILRPIDDSVVRVMDNNISVLRRARGFAPLPIHLKCSSADSKPPTYLAVGGHLKNTVAVNVGSSVVLSPHIGDLDSYATVQTFHTTTQTLQDFYEVKPTVLICDQHPDYYSTHYAVSQKTPVLTVQHHEAHVAACMAEHHVTEPVLGVCWDGSGYGSDHTLWGGEFFIVRGSQFERIQSFRQFRLPGGKQAIREPRRVALGLLHEMFGETIQTHALLRDIRKQLPDNFTSLCKILSNERLAPLTSSVGRLFDAVASLLNLKQRISFEGQAAMAVEFAADRNHDRQVYPFYLNQEIDWSPMIYEILTELSQGVSVTQISKRFHNTLSHIILAVAQAVGIPSVVLSGGCFQNKLLTESTIEVLREAGFSPYWPQQVPTNDGGIALGQIAVAFGKRRQDEETSLSLS